MRPLWYLTFAAPLTLSLATACDQGEPCGGLSCDGGIEEPSGSLGEPWHEPEPDLTPGKSGFVKCEDGQRVVCSTVSDELTCGFAQCVDGSFSVAGCSAPGVWYTDADADGYGDAAATTYELCEPPGTLGSRNVAALSGDCNDDDRAIHPGAAEACNAKDDDCDGTVDDGVGDVYVLDCDGDGYIAADQPATATPVCLSALADPASACKPAHGTAQWIIVNDKPVDCWDRDDRVHPDATTFESDAVAYKGGFDFDCSTAEEAELAQCPAANTFEASCTADKNEGARCFNAAAPACGSAAKGLVCRCSVDAVSGDDECAAETADVAQACR